MEIRVNPLNKTETYSSQYGGINITTNGISSSDRYNWRCPIRLDPVDPAVRYFGTNKLYKFNPTQNKWTAISGDLTKGNGGSTGSFGTITTIAVAPANNNYIYTGSDDGQVYVTKNGGSSWTKITNGLPELWTMFIKTDRQNPEIAYVGFSGYRYGTTDAHIYKTTNGGTTWKRISNNLPQMPVNDFETDPVRPNIFYLATDIGVYASVNGGHTWIRLGKDMPAVVVSTLNFTVNARQLYAATYGRSIYKIQLPFINPHDFTDTSYVAENNLQKISLTPNPANNYTVVHLTENEKGIILEMYNNSGRKILTEKIAAHVLEQKINLQNIPTGIYTLLCMDGNKKSTTQLVIEK